MKQPKLIKATGFEVLTRYPFTKIKEGQRFVLGYGGRKSEVCVPKPWSGVMLVVHSFEVIEDFIKEFIVRYNRDPEFIINPQGDVWYKRVTIK